MEHVTISLRVENLLQEHIAGKKQPCRVSGAGAGM